jgi:hypothetical protein
MFLDDELVDEFFSTEYEDVKKVALYILDSSGNVEDVLIDLDEILNYVKKLHEKYPTVS